MLCHGRVILKHFLRLALAQRAGGEIVPVNWRFTACISIVAGARTFDPPSTQGRVMLIRAEGLADEAAIEDLTTRAFTGMPYSEGTEAAIIRLLRQSGDLALSLVAEEHGIVIGHVAFSPIRAGTHKNWFGLGPIAVEPARQGSGIGKALIKSGLEILKGRGAAGVALIGNPEVYYSSGFVSDGQLTYKGLETRYVQRIVFCGPDPEGELHFAPAFEQAVR